VHENELSIVNITAVFGMHSLQVTMVELLIVSLNSIGEALVGLTEIHTVVYSLEDTS